MEIHHAHRQQRTQAHLPARAGRPPVGFPAGAKPNGYGVDNETPSVVVLNGTEKEPSWQGVSHDKGVVIVNEVPEEAANTALDIYEQGGKTNAALMLALYFLAASGCRDQYTTGLSFVDSKLTPAGRTVDQYTGIVKRDDRDLTPVWREGDVYYTAPGGNARVIEADILARTYRNADGSLLDLAVVPEGRPEGIAA